MATTIQAASVFNVEASLNAHFNTSLTAITRPSWLSTMPTIEMTMPETGITPPAFSFSHIDVGTEATFQGRNVHSTGALSGVTQRAIMEINCWVTRANNGSWLGQLNTMRDMCYTVFSNTISVVIQDYVSDLATPSDTVFLVRLDGIHTVATGPDQDNPDIERRRILIDYHWVYRSQ